MGIICDYSQNFRDKINFYNSVDAGVYKVYDGNYRYNYNVKIAFAL